MKKFFRIFFFAFLAWAILALPAQAEKISIEAERDGILGNSQRVPDVTYSGGGYALLNQGRYSIWEFRENIASAVLIFGKSKDGGLAEIYIDGKLYTTFDTYDGTLTSKYISVRQPKVLPLGLDGGEHTIKIISTGRASNASVTRPVVILDNMIVEADPSVAPGLPGGTSTGSGSGTGSGSSGSNTQQPYISLKLAIQPESEGNRQGGDIQSLPSIYEKGNAFVLEKAGDYWSYTADGMTSAQLLVAKSMDGTKFDVYLDNQLIETFDTFAPGIDPSNPEMEPIQILSNVSSLGSHTLTVRHSGEQNPVGQTKVVLDQADIRFLKKNPLYSASSNYTVYPDTTQTSSTLPTSPSPKMGGSGTLLGTQLVLEPESDGLQVGGQIVSSPSFSKGAALILNNSSEYWEYTGKIAELKIQYAKTPDGGTFDIYVDGSRKNTVNTFSEYSDQATVDPFRGRMEQFLAIANLDGGAHTIRIKNNGQANPLGASKIYLDQITIEQATTQIATTKKTIIEAETHKPSTTYPSYMIIPDSSYSKGAGVRISGTYPLSVYDDYIWEYKGRFTDASMWIAKYKYYIQPHIGDTAIAYIDGKMAYVFTPTQLSPQKIAIASGLENKEHTLAVAVLHHGQLVVLDAIEIEGPIETALPSERITVVPTSTTALQSEQITAIPTSTASALKGEIKIIEPEKEGKNNGGTAVTKWTPALRLGPKTEWEYSGSIISAKAFVNKYNNPYTPSEKSVQFDLYLDDRFIKNFDTAEYLTSFTIPKLDQAINLISGLDGKQHTLRIKNPGYRKDFDNQTPYDCSADPEKCFVEIDYLEIEESPEYSRNLTAAAPSDEKSLRIEAEDNGSTYGTFALNNSLISATRSCTSFTSGLQQISSDVRFSNGKTLVLASGRAPSPSYWEFKAPMYSAKAIVKLISPCAFNNGYFQEYFNSAFAVYLDNKKVGEFKAETDNSNGFFQMPIQILSNLDGKEHTLRIEPLPGAYNKAYILQLDAIEITAPKDSQIAIKRSATVEPTSKTSLYRVEMEKEGTIYNSSGPDQITKIEDRRFSNGAALQFMSSGHYWEYEAPMYSVTAIVKKYISGSPFIVYLDNKFLGTFSTDAHGSYTGFYNEKIEIAKNLDGKNHILRIESATSMRYPPPIYIDALDIEMPDDFIQKQAEITAALAKNIIEPPKPATAQIIEAEDPNVPGINYFNMIRQGQNLISQTSNNGLFYWDYTGNFSQVTAWLGGSGYVADFDIYLDGKFTKNISVKTGGIAPYEILSNLDGNRHTVRIAGYGSNRTLMIDKIQIEPLPESAALGFTANYRLEPEKDGIISNSAIEYSNDYSNKQAIRLGPISPIPASQYRDQAYYWTYKGKFSGVKLAMQGTRASGLFEVFIDNVSYGFYNTLFDNINYPFLKNKEFIIAQNLSDAEHTLVVRFKKPGFPWVLPVYFDYAEFEGTSATLVGSIPASNASGKITIEVEREGLPSGRTDSATSGLLKLKQLNNAIPKNGSWEYTGAMVNAYAVIRQSVSGAIAKVYLDNNYVNSFSTYAKISDPLYGVKILLVGGLDGKEHTLRIEYSSFGDGSQQYSAQEAAVDLDKLEIETGSSATSQQTSQAPSIQSQKIEAETACASGAILSEARASGGKICQLNAVGKSAEFSGTMESANLYVTKTAFGTSFDVYIDGVKKQTYDTYDPTSYVFQQKINIASGLPKGKHSIKISHPGIANPRGFKSVDLDFIEFK